MNRDLLTDNEMTDVEAWARFRKGEEVAFEWLYRRYFKSLARYGLKLTANTDAVEDAIHDLFMDLWRRRTFLAEVTNPRFYLFRSLRNQLIRNSRHDVLEDSKAIEDCVNLVGEPSAEFQLISHESRDEKNSRVKNAIARLSPRQQEVITLRFFHGFSMDETSALMGMPKQSVSNLMFRAYNALRLHMQSAVYFFFLVVARLGGV